MKTTLILLAGAFVATSATAQMAPSEAQTTPAPAANTTASPAADTAEAAPRDALTAAGYTDVRALERNGDGWKGTAMHNSKRVPVTVAADGRIVTPK